LGELENVRLVHQRHALSAVGKRVLERIAHDPLRTVPGNHGHRLCGSALIGANFYIVLDTDIQPLGVFANDHEINILKAQSGHDRLRRTHVRIQIELLSECDVDRPKSFADRRLERSLERVVSGIGSLYLVTAAMPAS
jgi:hypothetical protein